MKTIEVRAVVAGAAQRLEVLEVLVRVGEAVEAGALLATLESARELVELRSPETGRVSEVCVAVGAQLTSGDTLLRIEIGAPRALRGATAVTLPDVGDIRDLVVIEILARPGDRIKQEQALITVESDKASMEIPSPAGGVLNEFKVQIGDVVNIGDLIALIDNVDGDATAVEPSAQTAVAPIHGPTAVLGDDLPHASPSVRKFARELGVPLEEVKGSGPKGRITQDDLQAFTKAVMSGAASTKAAAAKASAGGADGAALGLIPWPKVDFTKFGTVERKELSRIKKLSGANLHRNWVMIPHVTNNDEADITALEAFRVATNKENEKSGVKVTMLAFVIKAVVSALKKFPEFNTSLDGDTLVYKQYYNIGFAADTPNGLVVPVLKDADKKGILQISQEMGELAKKARDGKLGGADMQGGCFSISSLGGIGGTHFTPIINAPEVAILGLSKSAMKPVWDGKQFVPQLTLPLSLSYDHRVIDGASAARFNAYLGQVLADFRRVLL